MPAENINQGSQPARPRVCCSCVRNVQTGVQGLLFATSIGETISKYEFRGFDGSRDSATRADATGTNLDQWITQYGSCISPTQDREQVCYRTEADPTNRLGWARHDDTLVGVTGVFNVDPAGIAYFTQTVPVQPLDITQPGFEFVTCKPETEIKELVGCLGDAASADLSEATRCQVTEVVLNGETIDVNLEPGWTVQQLVDAVNAVAPDSLAVENGELVNLPERSFGNLQIVCEIVDFEENFGTGGSNGNRQMVASTTYNFCNSGSCVDNDYFVTSFQDAGLAGYSTRNGTITADSEGDPDGNAMFVLASGTPGQVFSLSPSVVVGQEYRFSFKIIDTTVGGAGLIRPNVKMEIVDTSTGNVIGEVDTGPVPWDGVWHEYNIDFVAPVTTLEMRMSNNAAGGTGNDFAVDQIEFARLSRQNFSFEQRGEQIPVKIVQAVTCDGDIQSVRVYSSDGQTEYTLPDPENRVLSTGPCRVATAEQNRPQEVRACLLTEYRSWGLIQDHVDAINEAITEDANGNSNITVDGTTTQFADQPSVPNGEITAFEYVQHLNDNHGGGWEIVDELLVQNPVTLTAAAFDIEVTPEDDTDNVLLRRSVHTYQQNMPVKVIQSLEGGPGNIRIEAQQVFPLNGGAEIALQDNQTLDLNCIDNRISWKECVLDRLVLAGRSTEIEQITEWRNVQARVVDAEFRTPEGTVHTVTVLSSNGNGILDNASGSPGLIRQGANVTHTTPMIVTIEPPFPEVTEVRLLAYDMDGPPTNNERMGAFSFGEGTNFTPPNPVNYALNGGLYAYTGSGTANGPEANFSWVFGGQELSDFSWTRRAVQGLNSFLAIEFYTEPTSYDTVELVRVFKKDCNTDVTTFQDHNKATGADHIQRDGAAIVACSTANWQNIGETCFLDLSSGDGFVQAESYNFRDGDDRPGNNNDHGDNAGNHWLNTIDYCFAYQVESDMVVLTQGSVPWLVDPQDESIYMNLGGPAAIDVEWNMSSTNSATLSRASLEFEVRAGGNVTFLTNLPSTVEVLSGTGTYTAPTFSSPADTSVIRVTWFNWTGTEQFRFSPKELIKILGFGYDITFPTGERGLVTTQVDGSTGELRYINQSTGSEVNDACIIQCPTRGLARSDSLVCLCDDNGPFLRFIQNDGEGRRTPVDYMLDGRTLYQTVGDVRKCGSIQSEIGCLSSPASADLVSTDRCEVDAVIINGTEIDLNPNLPPNWTVSSFVDAVNNAQPGTLELNGSTIVTLPERSIGNIEILCVETDFSENFGEQPGAGPNPGDGTINDLAGAGSTGTTTYNYDSSGNITAANSYHVSRVRDTRPGSYPILNLGGAPDDVDATGDVNGNILVVNGSDTPGVFYSQTATGLVIGQEYQMRAFGAYLTEGAAAGTEPAVTLEILNGATVIASDGGDPIPSDGEWHTFVVRFVASSTSVTFRAVNSSPVVAGNDLGLDEITFSRVSRQRLLFQQLGDQIPVEIIKVISRDGSISNIRVFSPDGNTEFVIPDPEGRVLSTGPCVVPTINGTSLSDTQSDTVLPTRITATNAGATTAGIQSVAIANVGGAPGTVLGQTLVPGQVAEFEAYHDPVTNTYNRLDPIAYDATGTTFTVQQTP